MRKRNTMPLEIERKYLVNGDGWRKNASAPVRIRQKYIPLGAGLKEVIRLRIAGESAFLTLKTRQTGCVRGEYEYGIPPNDAEELMKVFCPGGTVEKLRYEVPHEGFLWVVDEFRGGYQGLVMAEIELKSADESFPPPPWLGREVTGDFHYSNSYLAENAT